MSKQKRVYELAREFKVSSQAMIEVLQNLGFEIKSHMSPVNEVMEQDVQGYFAGQKAEAKAEDSRKKEVADKRKAIEKAEKDAAKLERDARSAKWKAEKEEKEAQERQLRRKLEEEASRRVAEKLTRAKSETERLRQQAAEAKRRVAEQQKAATPAPAADEPVPAAVEPTAPPPGAEEAAALPESPPAEPTSPRETTAPEPLADETARREEATEGDRSTGRLSGASLRERIKQSKEARETEGVGPRIIERKAPQPRDRRPAPTTPAPETRPKKRRRKGRKEVDAGEVRTTIRETLADLRSGRSKTRRKRRDTEAEETVSSPVEERRVIRVAEFASISELASTMGAKPNEIIGACFQLGLVVTINQRLDMETIEFIADEFGYEVEAIEEYGADAFDQEQEETDESQMTKRAPIVTVMGHVDHGKTSLLDYVRRTSVVAGEVGGITQHIGAYEVATDRGPITFLDTPGHEAFTAMRARGAQLTDIVVLVVAADDKVMPQTVEAINHARAASVPIVVAINKIDRPDADIEGVMRQLSQHKVMVEEYGGETVAVPVSAKSGEGIDRMLEMILLQADILELKADSNGLARGVVVESELDRGRGPVATVLVQKGTLREGEAFLCGLHSGRVRALMDERGNRVEQVGPSQPVAVVGFDGLPQPGDSFYAVAEEKEARELSQKRQQIKREQEFAVRQSTSLSDLRARVEKGELEELPLIIKADADGSLEALSDSLLKLSTDEVQVRVLHKGVGAISETDVMLAQASGAVVIGFHVRPDKNAREVAEQSGVEIRLYEIIYEAVEEIKQGLEGLLKPDVQEQVLGTLQVRETFRIPRAGTIAGCYVTDGTIRRNSLVRLVRDGVSIYQGRVESLKRFKEDAREVREGFECGVGLQNFNDVKVGDVIEVFERKEIARTL